jgi:hypothetical protein
VTASNAASAPSVESETELLARLDALVEARQITLALVRGKLGHLDFPLALEADGNRWAYPLFLVAGITWWQFGTALGIAAMAAAAVIYQTLGRAYMARRLERRIRERGLKETETWRRLWRFGGVILIPAEGGRAPCQGPDGNWMALVRAVPRR